MCGFDSRLWYTVPGGDGKSRESFSIPGGKRFTETPWPKDKDMLPKW